MDGDVRFRAVEEPGSVGLSREVAARTSLAAGPTVPHRLSQTLAHRQPEREAATHRGASPERGCSGADRRYQPLARMRRFFGLEVGGLAARG
jgi:hypothetical protein